jgi:hypothetical protein
VKASCETHESVPTPQLLERQKRMNVNFKAGSCHLFSGAVIFHMSIVRSWIYIFIYVYILVYIYMFMFICEFFKFCLVGAPGLCTWVCLLL